MYYLLIIIYIVSSIMTIFYLYKIFATLNTINSKDSKEKANNKKNIRIHPGISQSNYDNSFGGRKAYEKYQNKDGLYEPVRPSKGINLKKEA